MSDVCVVGTALNPVPTKEKLYDLYWNEGLSCSEIGKMYGRTPSMAWKWLKKNSVQTREFSGRSASLSKMDKNKWINEDGFWRPRSCPSLSYILGVLVGDGSVSVFRRGDGRMAHRIRLDAVSKRFCLSFIDAIKDIGLRPPKLLKRKRRGNANPQYIAMIENRLFALWYKDITLDTLREEVGRNKVFKIEFIRGFYESEGTIWRKQGNGHLRLRMNNTNKKLILFIKEILESLGYHPTVTKYVDKRKNHKPWYNLTLHAQEEIACFLKIIKPCIRVKPKGES